MTAWSSPLPGAIDVVPGGQPARGVARHGSRGPRQWVAPPSRRRAVEELRESLREQRSVMVVGEAGVGKTALAARALEGLTVDGQAPVAVALTGASARAGLPLSALEPLLGDEILAYGSFARTVRALHDSLAELSAGSPVVLRLDDAHLLDDASAQALAWVVRQDEVVLVATMRPAGASGSPWLELWKDDVVERVDVSPFTVSEMEQWLAGELGGTPTADTVQRVWGETQGNVFHARELVRAEKASGALREYDSVWVWTGRATPGARLLEIVENDVSRLSSDAHRALEVVAMLCPAPLSLLLDAVPQAAVDELVHGGVATLRPERSAGGGSEIVVDLAHALYAEAVRARVPGGRRREVLDLVADSTHAATGASLLRSVLLAMDAGLAVGPHRLESAIEEAFTLQQPDVVVRLIDLALRSATVGGDRWAQLMNWRAQAWWAQTDLVRAQHDAETVIDTLRALPTLDAGLALRLADAVQVVAASLHASGIDVAEALRVVDDAAAHLEAVRAPGTWRAELRATRLTRLGWGGYDERAHDEALALLAAPRVPATAVRLVAPTALRLANAGRFAEAHALCERHVPIAVAYGERYRWGVGEIAMLDAVMRLWSGDVRPLAMAEDPEAGAPLDWVATQIARGITGIAFGVWSQAATDLRAANARLRVDDSRALTAYTTAAEALAMAASGTTRAAHHLLDQLRTVPLRAAAALEPEIRLVRLDTLTWLHDEDPAREAASLAVWARERGALRVELEALHRYVRAGHHAPDVIARVDELATLVEGPRAAAVAAHVAALAAQDADLARIAERELNRCGLWLPPVEPPVALTPREREIASLAAGGMTSRAIAARLTLSVRTVDSHLARVFTKTGVHSREGLIAVLR